MQSQPQSALSLVPGEPPQDPELWLEDGNMVIIAGDSAFRVHTGVLSRHSEIFQHMFGVPQPALPAPSDVFDGQPAVHVSDSAHDFRQLLGMLYDGVRRMPPDEPVKFSILAAVARLSHKYHIEWLLEEATRRLRSVFAHTYDGWLKTRGRSNHLVTLRLFPSPWVEAMNLIRLLGEKNMLPVAIYHGCQFPSLLLRDEDRTRVDGTVESLDLPTLELCVNAHTRLVQRQSQLNADLFCAGPSKHCRSTKVCRTVIEAAYRKICGRPLIYLSGRPLDAGVLPLLVRLEEEGRMCSFCTASLFERERKGKMAVWKDLPGLLGVEVDGWDQRQQAERKLPLSLSFGQV